MNADPKLVRMIGDWRRLDALADELDKAKKGKKSDDAQAKATRLLHAIGDLPATSADDIILKLNLAAEAYGAHAPDRDAFLKIPEPPADFLFQSLLDAREIVMNGPKTVTVTDATSAALKAADIVCSLNEGCAALVLVCNAMTEEEKTAEFLALCFITGKLGEDVTAIGQAIDSIRGLPAAEEGGAS